MGALPLLEDGILEFLGDNPQIIVIAIVVIIGLLQGLGRTVKKMMHAAGADGGGPQGGRRRPGTQRRERASGGILEADPESILPGFMQTGIYERAQREGVVPEDEEPVVFHEEPQRADAPAVAFAESSAPARSRRERRQDREAAKRPVITPIAAPEEYQFGSAGTQVGGGTAGHLDTHDVAATRTTHDADKSLARTLFAYGRPSRDQVRTAILWGEIIGPPRAVRPYQSPARRGLRDSSSGPSAIAIMPLRDKPTS